MAFLRLPLPLPVLGLAALAASVIAQTPAPPASRAQGLRLAAACVIDGDRASADRLAQAVPGSAEEWNAQGALTPLVNHCLDGVGITDRTGTQASLAGLVAERLYVEQSRGQPPGSLHEHDPVTVVWTSEAAIGQCVVVAASPEVDRLLRSPPASSEEAATIQSLSATLARCVNRGQQMTTGPLRLRAELARALYRRVAEPRAQSLGTHGDRPAPRIGTPSEVLRQMVQRRYDGILAPGRDRLEVLQLALVQADSETAEAVATSPRDPEKLLDRAVYLSGRGRNEEALALLLPFTVDIAGAVAAGGRELVNEIPYILLILGRNDEAVTIMRRLAALPVAAMPSLINSRINYVQILVDAGRYQEALEEISAVGTRDYQYMNTFGQAWLATDAVCALAGLNRLTEARPFLERLAGLENTNPEAVTQAYLCAGEMDAAAGTLIRRLGGRDPARAILSLQNFDTGNGPVDPIYRRQLALRERPDVRAALARVGRVLTIPLPHSFWAYY